MTFVFKAGAVNRPLPAFKAGLSRYEFQCGWCGESFMTAGLLVAHVRQERERCGNSAT